ncbi:hypothetical protein [Klebsiella sp. BIGb0407]|uniref:SpaN/EivJ family type III secretion system needle length determinant n=1 Tax=Klebsiella sp. BIGb0407 TaxID=2940603 RepID=UPI00216777AB|nr:hypothetical protein [Klebsiella sp. BIGb0407]MCS3431544.1 hypothetical protein [Klebsiella sp. BIGb0407]
MIEKNSEVMSELTTFSEKKFDDQDFLTLLNKNKNGHGEDVSIRILSVLPELYHKHIHSSGRCTLSTTRNNHSIIHNVACDEIRQSRAINDITLSAAPTLSESNTSLRDGTFSSNSRLGIPEVIVANRSGEFILENEDDLKESNKETTKIYSPPANLKTDVLPRRQELPRQDMQSRRLQSSATEHMLKVHVDSITKTAATQRKSLNIDYPFLRWSGERSVKVSIPVDLSPSRHLTLLPSDSRAAEMLSRQVGQLSGFTTELLHPQQDDEEDEERHNQYKREKEQE